MVMAMVITPRVTPTPKDLQPHDVTRIWKLAIGLSSRKEVIWVKIGWWFQTWIVFSISYMGCHPLTKSYFSRWAHCTTKQYSYTPKRSRMVLIPNLGPIKLCKRWMCRFIGIQIATSTYEDSWHHVFFIPHIKHPIETDGLLGEKEIPAMWGPRSICLLV